MPSATGLPHPNAQAAFYDSVPTKRLIAWAIDMAITGLLAAPFIMPTVAISTILFFPILLVPWIWITISCLYRWATISSRSATWGMRIMGIELRDHYGQHLSGTLAGVHTLASMICFGMPMVQTLSVLLMVTSKRGQGLPDMVLGTVMLNRARR